VASSGAKQNGEIVMYWKDGYDGLNQRRSA